MLNKRLTKYYFYNARINIIFSAILTAIISYYNLFLGVIVFLAFLAIMIKTFDKINTQKKDLSSEIEEITLKLRAATKRALVDLPVAIAILDESGIIWYNASFRDSVLKQVNQNEIIKRLKSSGKMDADNKLNIGDKCYVIIKKVVNYKNKDLYVVYFRDITYEVQLRKSNEELMPVVGLIQIDNYDEVMQGLDDLKKPLLIAEIDNKLNLWATSLDACLRKFENDSYIVFMTNKGLKEAEGKKFDILDTIRDIDLDNKIPVTLSMGIAVLGNDIREVYHSADAALDLALGRGGDQAVVKRNDKVFYYGGKTQAVEKRTRVRARVISHALGQLISESSNVVIMGHNFMDMDSLGSAIGILRASWEYEKSAYIVLDKVNVTINDFIEKILREDMYKKSFLDINKAETIIDDMSLLVVVDTQRPSYMTSPALLKKTNRIVVIDHHRRSKDSIEKTMLSYLEPYASSTCELVTELLQYLKDKIDIKDIEAEALMAGMMIDTKNFTFKTGVRTFEAASYLRRSGADSTRIVQLFKNDIDSFTAKSDIIKTAEITKRGIAISVCPGNVKNAQLLVAQAADELLNIKGVEASFVLSNINGTTVISGRSLGDINVQLILEKLGGGGHLGVAGAQLADTNIDEAKKILFDAIENYFKEGEE